MASETKSLSRVHRLLRASLGAALLLTAAPDGVARAGTPEDVFGVGARTIAMGGAGTATANDFSAAYYGIANAGFCPENEIAVDIRSSWFAAELAAEDPTAPPEATELDGPTEGLRLSFGLCLKLPYRLSMGMLMGLGVPSPLGLSLGTTDSRVRFPLHGSEQEQLSITIGGAYRPIDELSLGLGVSILVSSNAWIGAEVGASGSLEVEANAAVDITPQVGVTAGVHTEPIPGLHLAATYRQQLSHELYAEASIDVEGVDVLACLAAQGWFTPHQVALGSSYEPVERLTVAADLTWYGWSRFQTNFLQLWALSAGNCSEHQPGDILQSSSPPTNVGFRDIWQPRLGVEYRLPSIWAFRMGYSFRPSIIDESPSMDQQTTLLDSDTHAFSAGIGIRLALGDEGAPEEGAPEDPMDGATASADFYFRASYMPGGERLTLLENMTSATLLTYSAALYELGMTLTLGWP